MRILAIIIGFLLVPALLWAVVELDGSVSFNSKTSTGTTLTQAQTITTSGGNRALYVLCGTDNGASAITLTATYAGAAMTPVISDFDTGGGSVGVQVAIFRKIDPATGTNNWVVTQSTGISMVCYGRSFTNVDPATPETDSDSICSDGTAGTTRTLTLTTAATEFLLDVLTQGSNAATGVNQGANQTDEVTDGGVDNTAHRVAGSRQLGSTDGIMSWSWTGAQHSCLASVSIKNSDFSAVIDAGSIGVAGQ